MITMRRQRMWQLKYKSGSPTDMNVSSSKEGWGTSLLKYINKKFTNLRGKCKEIQLHGEINTIQCQVFQHGERTCRQLCADAADEVGPVRHSSHPVRLHRWQVWSPQASRPQHLWALSGTGAISNKCWWWFTRCCSFCHFGDSVVHMLLRGYWQILCRLQWISATWWIWGKWPRTSQWTCQSTCSGKKPSTPAFFLSQKQEMLPGTTGEWGQRITCCMERTPRANTSPSPPPTQRRWPPVQIFLKIIASVFYPAVDPGHLHWELEGHAWSRRHLLLRQASLHVCAKLKKSRMFAPACLHILIFIPRRLYGDGLIRFFSFYTLHL